MDETFLLVLTRPDGTRITYPGLTADEVVRFGSAAAEDFRTGALTGTVEHECAS